MKTIIITGTASGAGKTTFLSRVIKKLTNITNKIGVIKCSISDGILEPIVTDKKDVITEDGTDTALLDEAGSDKTVFIKSSRDNLEALLNKAGNMVKDVNYLFIEGNSAAKYMTADLIIYLDNPESEMKGSAEEVLKRADIIINSQELFKKEDISDVSFKFNIDIIICQKALIIAKVLGLKPILIGKKLNKEKVKLSGCQLGCF